MIYQAYITIKKSQYFDKLNKKVKYYTVNDLVGIFAYLKCLNISDHIIKTLKMELAQTEQIKKDFYQICFKYKGNDDTIFKIKLVAVEE